MEIFALLLLLTAVLSPDSAANAACLSPGSNWQVSYLSDLGLCYYFRDYSNRIMSNRSVVSAACRQATAVTDLPSARLPRLATEQARVNLIRTMGKVGTGYWQAWTEAECNTNLNRFEWGDGSPVSELSHFVCTNATLGVIFNSSLVISGGSFATVSKFYAVPVTTEATTVCEYELPKCNMSVLANFDSSRMEPSVTPFTGRRVKAACSEGFFRKSETGLATASKTRNQYDCVHVDVDNGIGYGKLVPLDADASVEACESMHCKGKVLLNLTLDADFKESYKSLIDPNYEYQFGDVIHVECVTGYVKLSNLSDVNSTITCKQNSESPSEGQWNPIFCTPVPCNSSAMSSAYDPTIMKRYKAYDRQKDVTYPEVQTNKFPYYPNKVYVCCKQAGQFFKDRKYDKVFQCNLAPNSSTKAVWSPVEGTMESSMICQAITCLTNEVVISSQENQVQEYLTSGNFNSTFEVTDESGLTSNYTIKEFVSNSEYKYNVVVKVFCKSGYAMTSTDETSGKAVSITETTSRCSKTGSWSTRISECIKKSASIDTGSSKKYTPEAKEADSAQSLGAIVIVILVVFFSVIVILDLTTLSRDIKLLRQNLRRLKLKAMMRNKNKEIN